MTDASFTWNGANMIRAALKYQELGFSVIPVKQNKRPYTKWEEFQTKKADTDQVRAWWKQWPSANVGLVTGEISGIDVVDCDSQKGLDALNEFLPETIVLPIAKTPNGWHYYFKHQPGLPNKARIITDCDVRTTGGYIIAPPSKNGTGEPYAWQKGLKITDVSPPPMPDMLFDILSAHATGLGFQTQLKESGNSRAHARGVLSTPYSVPTTEGPVRSTDYPVPTTELEKKVFELDHKARAYGVPSTEGKNATSATNRNIRTIFQKGSRDDTLFHLANSLVKGGMSDSNLLNYMLFFASHCEPPFPEKEVLAKIESAKKRNLKADFNISEEVRDFVVTSSGFFLTSDCFNRLQDPRKRRLSLNCSDYTKKELLKDIAIKTDVIGA